MKNNMLILQRHLHAMFLPLVALILLMVLPMARAADWPQWRGINRDSISLENDLHLDWTNTQPKELWRTNIGFGFSSFAVVHDRVYTMGWSLRTCQDTLWCFDAASGKVLWSYSYPAESAVWVDTGRRCPQFMGPRATPVVQDGCVYIASADGQAACLDAESGKLVWQKNVAQETHVKRHDWWSFAGSPLLAGDLLILPFGKFGVAVKKATGELVWCSGKDVSGLCAPSLVNFQGQDCLLNRSSTDVFLASPADGKVLWRYRWGNSFDSADPLVIDGQLLLAGAYSKQTLLIKLGEQTPLWKNSKLIPEVASPLLYKGQIYSESGYIAGPIVNFDIKEQAIKWSSASDQVKMDFTALIVADDKIIAQGNRGEMGLFATDPAECHPLGSFRLQPKTTHETWWTLPALSNGRLFVRSAVGTMIAYDLRQTGKPDEYLIPDDPRRLDGPEPLAEFTMPANPPAPSPYQQPQAADWTGYRGPQRNGVASAPGLAWDWAKNPPKPLWRINIGNGYSQVLTAPGRVYTMGWRIWETDYPHEFIWCLDSTTGKALWRTDYTCTDSGCVVNKDRANAPECMGPRSTLSLDGDRLYLLNPAGGVACFNAATGAQIWMKNVCKDFGSDRPAWSFAGSPLVLGKLLILPADSAGLALDKLTGAAVWQTGSEVGGNGSPMLVDYAGSPKIALWMKDHLALVDPADGKIAWQFPWGQDLTAAKSPDSAPATKPGQPATKPTPIDTIRTDPLPLPDGKVLVCARGHGAALLMPGSDKPVWQSPDLETWLGSPVIFQGFVYGPGPHNDELVCLDLKDGSTKWHQKMDVSQLTLADGHLVVQCRDGMVCVVQATPASYQPLGQIQALDSQQCWTPVSIVGNRMYCRSWDGDLAAYEIK